MLCYKLESDEVALFESDVSLKENKDKNVILITNHNIVIETTKKKMFKKPEFSLQVYPTSDIKLYNDQPQIKQKSNDVFVSLINKELQLTFESMFLARKFVTKAVESVTGKTVSTRGAGKIKSAIGLVDDTLGIDTIGTISGVMENGVVKSILGGTKSRQNAESVSNNSGIIETVADVVEIATGKDVPKLNPNNKCEMSYDEKIDAVKKLKGLLDMGAITQEEFDAKKKDLLGLWS